MVFFTPRISPGGVSGGTRRWRRRLRRLMLFLMLLMLGGEWLLTWIEA